MTGLGPGLLSFDRSPWKGTVFLLGEFDEGSFRVSDRDG